MSWSQALEKYALMSPQSIKKEILLTYTENSLTIEDAFAKAMYHYLVLPRLPTAIGVNQARLSSLKSLLSGDKKEALNVLKALKNDAEEVETIIKAKMQQQHGFEWQIQIGFHAVPSMTHLHLHVISSDLVSPALKNKKHYNSFHPSLGFYLHLTDVMDWLNNEKMVKKLELPAEKYEPLLKTNLSCLICDEPFSTMPKLKSHLEQEWKQLQKSSVKRHQNKRPREDDNDVIDEQVRKKAHTSENAVLVVDS